MKEDVKAAFKKAITQFDAREEAADHERKKVATARQEFETECKRVIDQVIVPTLNEIGGMLQQSGWIYTTALLPAETGVRFEIYRGNMMAAGGIVRPHIAFSSLPERPKLGIISYSQTSGGGPQEYDLGQVSDDFVASQVLPFFERLAAERR